MSYLSDEQRSYLARMLVHPLVIKAIYDAHYKLLKAIFVQKNNGVQEEEVINGIPDEIAKCCCYLRTLLSGDFLENGGKYGEQSVVMANHLMHFVGDNMLAVSSENRQDGALRDVFLLQMKSNESPRAFIDKGAGNESCFDGLGDNILPKSCLVHILKQLGLY